MILQCLSPQVRFYASTILQSLLFLEANPKGGQANGPLNLCADLVEGDGGGGEGSMAIFLISKGLNTFVSSSDIVSFARNFF